MSDKAPPTPDLAESAGSILRNARKARGLHIAALAAQIKVTPQKLEALELDRYDELLDATFARALAKTVCRQLHIDPEPVLARLPAPPAQQIAHLARGPAAPFRERPGREPAESSLLSRPAVWGPLLILVAAIVVYFVPSHWIRHAGSGDATAGSAVKDEAVPTPTVQSVPAVPTPPPAASAVAVAAPAATPAPSAPIAEASPAASAAAAPDAAASGTLIVRTAAKPSWIEVVDSRGEKLLSRTVQPGELLALDGVPPLKVRIGNVSTTQLQYRGQAVDLARFKATNQARLELK